MQTTTLKPFCNVCIDLRYEFRPEAPMTFVFSGGYGIFNFEEPVQVALVELLSKYRMNWVQFLYQNRKLPLCYRFIQEAEEQNLEERARNINCDVYAFQGGRDPIISPRHIQRLSAEASNWHAKIIDVRSQ